VEAQVEMAALAQVIQVIVEDQEVAVAETKRQQVVLALLVKDLQVVLGKTQVQNVVVEVVEQVELDSQAV
jgi:hypothetical protein